MVIEDKSPLYFAINEDRYRRRDRIREIQDITKRKLIVYESNLTRASIDHNDILPFGDLLKSVKNEDIDLLLQSSGGDIDKAEKIIYMCRQKSKSFRVIVADCAKSAATLICLAADSIVMGYTSELGPIDPQIVIRTFEGEYLNRPAQSFLDGLNRIIEESKKEGLSPAYFPILQKYDPALIDFCHKAIERSRQFAEKWLKKYMCKNRVKDAEKIAKKLMNVKKYLSHGTVIEKDEAINLGLVVDYLEPDNPLWELIWLLHCSYEVIMRKNDIKKFFESEEISIPML